MCGICGLAGFANSGLYGADEPAIIERMMKTLVHRGPDDGGSEYIPAHDLGLGHRRLSIIDLSERGRQPMSNEDGTLRISFNGEIYNHRELKETLDPVRHQFRSVTDTETILHLYEERGTAAFAALNGMFALALYDAPRQRLFLVRDQFGIKPLYYYSAGGRLLFGSEIKCLLATGHYTPEVDWQSVHDFFSYLYVPSPQTMFRGISQVPAAHILEYDLRQRCIHSISRYGAISRYKSIGTTKNPRDFDEESEIRRLMTASVKRQMISDVPLGAFLSGGVDSNIIVGLMAEQSSRPVKTFTVRFDEPGMEYYDERREARRIAERFGTEHHELPIDLSHPEEMLDLLEYFDQPFGNTTFYLTSLLSRYTREHVKVALSGAGGDELFGGYPRYRAVQAMRWLRLIPGWAGRAALNLLSPLRDRFADRRLHRVRALLAGLDPDPATQYLKWVYYLDETRKAELLRPRADAPLPSARILADRLRDISANWPTELDDGNRFSFLDVETFLPDNLLEYSDRMSMAWSLELRVPFLDPELVELAFRIPFNRKMDRHGSKLCLRRAFADLIPEENRGIPKKGFNLPLGAWMRSRFDRYFDDLLPRDYVEREGIFNFDAISRLRDEHRRGRRDNSYELFAILSFDTWYRKYITRTLPMKLFPGII
jgi:asparagine synthase (glutamine-hydrolysing)